MEVALSCDDPEWDSTVDATFRREVRRIELALIRARTPPEPLRAVCHPLEDGRSEVELEVAGRVAHQVQPGLTTALRRAFEDLRRQIGAPVHRMAEVEAAPAGGPPIEAGTRAGGAGTGASPRAGGGAEAGLGASDAAVEAVRRVYPALVRIAAHEVARELLERRLEADDVDPQDLADAAVTAVLPELPPDVDPAGALRRLRKELRQRLGAIERDNDEAALEERSLAERIRRVSEALAVADQHEEVSDGWLPEGDFALADVLPDPSTVDPGEEVDDRDERIRLVEALFELGEDDRRDWLEVVVEGWAPDVYAAAQGREEAEVHQRLQAIRDALSDRLGVSLDQVDRLYSELGEQYRSDAVDVG